MIASLLIATALVLLWPMLKVNLRLRKNEKSLRQALSHSAATVRSWRAAHDAMCLTDAQGVISQVNDSFCEVFGKPREQLEGHPFTICYADSGADQRLGEHRRQLAERKVVAHSKGEEVLWDGRKISLDIRNSVLEFPEGPALLSTFRNDPQASGLEAEVENLQQQLIQSRKFETAGRLARSAAHDFNNLLTIINGYSQLMLDQFEDNKELRLPLEQIHLAGQRASEITRRLLSSKEPHRQETEGQPPPIPEEADQTDPDGPIPESMGDGETLLVVEDEIEVRTYAAAALRRRGYRILEAQNGEDALRIAASHDGRIDLVLTDVVMPGVKGPELVARLRSSSSVTKVLYMSGYPETAVLQQARLEAGFAFLQKPFTSEILSAKVREVLSAPVAACRILLVDDEEVVRRLFREVLMSAGYEVREAGNGKEAMQLVKNEPFELIITDLIMPEPEGIETIRDLRVQYPTLKIIAVSGAFGGKFLSVAEKMGALTTLQKPVSPRDLLASVRGVLAR